MLGSEVTDLSQCPPEPVQQQRQQGAAFAVAVAPLFPNPGIAAILVIINKCLALKTKSCPLSSCV